MGGLSGLSALTGLSAVVGGSGGSEPLEITSDGGGPTASIDYDEGITSAVTTVQASGGTAPYVFSITGGADAAMFEIDEDTGVLTPLVAFDYLDPTDSDEDGVCDVEVTVTDAALDTDSQTLTITIKPVEQPFIATLTISNLSNFLNGSNTQGFKLAVERSGGTTSTATITFDGGGATLVDSGTMAAFVRGAILSVTGGSVDTVTVTDISSGGNYVYTVSIAEVSGVISLTLDEAGSQLYPTVTLTESVVQQGVEPVQAVVSITADDPTFSSGDTTTDSNGNSVTVDASNTYSGHFAGFGWTAGTPSGNTVVFTQDTAASIITTKNSGNGTVTTLVEGVTGVVEIHLISRNIAPTGGTWKPLGAGTSVLYNSDGGIIAGAIGSSFSSACTADNPLSMSNVTVTASVPGDVGDTALDPQNVDLEAPAISVDIVGP